MKVAPKVIFLFRDADGFGTAISDALQPNPSSSLRRLEESFELSLEERYGIKDCKASGDIIHFVADDGLYQVSVLLLQNYEPPILVCAINEVLASIAGKDSSATPLLVFPFIMEASKLKWEGKKPSTNEKVSLYGIQKGPETEVTREMVAKTQKPPPNLQVHHEALACCIHLLHILQLPSFFLIGQGGQHLYNKPLEEELEVIYGIGDLLANISCLSFVRERIKWNPKKTSRDSKEPWWALYG